MKESDIYAMLGLNGLIGNAPDPANMNWRLYGAESIMMLSNLMGYLAQMLADSSMTLEKFDDTMKTAREMFSVADAEFEASGDKGDVAARDIFYKIIAAHEELVRHYFTKTDNN